MKGESKKLVKFFEGSDKRFCIPLYQRNYDWREANCRQLFDDLILAHHKKNKSHFFGSIVSSLDDDDDNVRLIIDGQQRITTVSLLLIAMVKAAESGDLSYDDKDRIDYIRETYLIDKYEKEKRKVKLKPIKNDMQAFDALLFQVPDAYLKDSNVTKNYLFFYDKIKTCGLTLEQLLDSIKKLEIIDIHLDRDDDPQLIFESLNSTGLDLSEADKIRNFLLMSLSAREQEEAYSRYWNNIEEATNYQPDMFIRNYLTVKTRRIFKLENLYFDFKQYFVNTKTTREDIMADMLTYARQYAKVYKAKADDNALRSRLTRLSHIDSWVHMPFCMAYLQYVDEQKSSIDEVLAVFSALECYWVRRIICNLPSNALSKVFASLHYETLRQLEEKKAEEDALQLCYADVMRYILLSKSGTSALPTDAMVEEEMKTRNIYKLPLAYRYFIFERMNNGLSREEVDVYGGMKDGTISIEHIMPQTLSAQWKADLGPQYQEIHEKYLHTFANLTLSAYNSNYSNAPFKDKWEGMTDRDGHKVVGFKDSIYGLSADLKGYTQWTETEILDRQQKLIARFKTIWPMPESTFTPKRRPTDVVTYNEEELTGRAIVAFSLYDDRRETSTWRDMLVELCAMLHDKHKTAVELYCAKGASVYFSAQKESGYARFAEGCYVSPNNSTQQKMYIIGQLFKECALPDDALTFELAPLQTNAE